MVDAVQTVTASMQVDELRMRLVAHNAANALTHGFKRQYAAVQLATAPDGGLTPVVRTLVDARPAALVQTGDPLDVAIEGEGFFELRRGSEVLYTRRGHFVQDEHGRLVDEAGWALQGQAGDLTVSGAAPRIDSVGTVFDNDRSERVIGQLRLMTLPPGATPDPVSGTRFRAPGAQVAGPGEAGRIRQGFLERSNVDSATEMVRVVEAVRHFESGQRTLQALDALHEQLLRTLGSF